MPFARPPLMARATHYEALNLHSTATAAEIKARFYALSKKYHPDRLVSRPDSERHHARQRFQAVSEAYTILGNPESRTNYDLTMRNSASDSTSYPGSREADNAYYRTPGEQRQRYSGLNRTRMRAKSGGTEEESHGGLGRKTPRGSYPTNPYNTGLGGGYATGMNDDVPHFDYEKHMRQQLAYESFRKERDRKKAATKQGPIYASVFSSINLDPDAYRARSASFQAHSHIHPHPHTHRHSHPHPESTVDSSSSQKPTNYTQSQPSSTANGHHTFRPTTARFTQAAQSQNRGSSATQAHAATAKSNMQNTNIPPRARTQPQRQPHTYARSTLSSTPSSEFQLLWSISPGKVVGVLSFVSASMYVTLLASGLM